jgi:anthranilate phosphoribosyltransferase
MTACSMVLQKIVRGEIPSEQDTEEIFSQLLDADSDISDAQIGAYLLSTSLRLPSAPELFAAARQLRHHMRIVSRPATVHLLDTCGTGGSGLQAFNTSTVVALVCAAAGQPVAKHGNRAASSRSGSADVLEELGVRLILTSAQQAAQLEALGFVFLFAPDHHPATRRVGLIRRELGVRTIFNFLGPLANPAAADFQLLGVAEERLLEPMAEALLRLGVRRALVVRGRDGLDELSAAVPSDVCEVTAGGIKRYTIEPSEYAIRPTATAELVVESPAESAAAIRSVLAGEASGFREVVLLNAGAALYVAGRATSIADGIEQSRSLLDSGAVANFLDAVVEFSNQ